MKHSIALLLTLVCSTSHAEIYRYINESGKTVFTDRPETDVAEPLKLPQANLSASQTVAPNNRSAALIPADKKTKNAEYQLVRIESPVANIAVREGSSGNLSVTVSSEPILRTGHSYRLLLDGNPYGEPSSAQTFQLLNLDRGTHQLAVEILDKSGKSLIHSQAQEIHILRTSFAQKRRIKPCQKGDEKIRAECKNT